jgi:hypothetical protein
VREEFVLYRMFSADQRLIYAGRTINPIGRIKEHQHDKDWFDEVVTITLERHPSLEALIEAECEAIHTEGPAYNIRPERHVPTEKPQRNPATAEAKRRREAMATRSQQYNFTEIRRLGSFGYTADQLEMRVKMAREAGVSEDDITWAVENMHLDQRRDNQAMIERRLADTAANASD